MAYDEQLADRVRTILTGRSGVREQKMFGGLTFMLNGNMCCGVLKDDLVLRIGAEAAEHALREPHTRPMDFTGRPMTGMVMVAPDGLRTDGALRGWVDKAAQFAASLPPK